MFSVLLAASSWLWRQIPTFLVLLGLGVLGWWGTLHEWKLRPMLLLASEKKEDRPRGADPSEESGLGPITLASPEAASKAGIEVGEAKEQVVNQDVTAHAVLAFDQTRYAQLSARVAGTAWEVLRGVGERVEKGDVLALVAAPEVGRAKVDLLTALAQVDLRTRTLRQVEDASGVLPERQVRDAQMAVREARLKLLTEQQTLSNLGLVIRLEEFDKLSDDQAARKLRLLGLPANVLKKFDSATLPSNLLPLIAPFDGVIIRRDVVMGEVVGPTQPQFVLADTSRLWVQMDVRQEDVRQVAVGQEVEFRSDTTGQATTGRLTWISAEVDPKTRTVRARAEVSNPTSQGQEILRPATFGTAFIRVRSGTVLTVPDEAIQFDGKAHLVFVRVDEKTYWPRLVLPGQRINGSSELLDSRALLPAQTLGVLSNPTGPLQVALTWSALEPLLTTPRHGEPIVTLGSHILHSELLKSRIGSEE